MEQCYTGDKQSLENLKKDYVTIAAIASLKLSIVNVFRFFVCLFVLNWKQNVDKQQSSGHREDTWNVRAGPGHITSCIMFTA